MTANSNFERREEDARILVRVGDGDESAFAALYDRFAPALHAMALRIVFEKKEAEDVLQEAFHQIWRKASSYDPARSAAFTWAVMILRHKAIDRLRALKRRDRAVERAADFNYVPAIDEASAAVPFERERSAAVRSALSQIADEQKQAIGLAFFGGLTHEEIAAKLGEPLGTIKARIRRGLLKLRDCLKEAV